MEIVKKVDRTKITGNCSTWPADGFLIEVEKENIYMATFDGGLDIGTSVTLEPKDAIKLAETILKYYKSRGL